MQLRHSEILLDQWTQKSLKILDLIQLGKNKSIINFFRARFGVDKVKNAIHCTDLPEDGTLEAEYFFSIMQRE